MAKKSYELDRLMSNLGKNKESKMFSRARRQTTGPLTDEAKDWAENNAQKKNKMTNKMNPIQQQKYKKETPITKINKEVGGWQHSSENEAKLNSDNMEEYNAWVNRVTSRNTLAYGNKKRR